MRNRLRGTGWILLCLGILAVVVPAVPASAAGETLTVDISLEDGTPNFNADDAAGHDSSPTNGIVRTNDNLIYHVEVLVADADSTNTTITMELAQGTEVQSIPPFCLAGSTITPPTMPEPAIPTTGTSWAALPRQTITCNVGHRSANSTFVYPIAATVRPEVPNGHVLDTVTAAVTTDDVTTPAVSAGLSATVSARAQFDITKNALSLGENDGYISTSTRACSDGTGRVCTQYSQSILISAPFGGKGSTPLQSPITFTDDLSVDSLYPAGSSIDPDFIAAGTAALQKYGAAFISCGGHSWNSVYPSITSTHSAEQSVRHSGSITCEQPGGPGTPVYYTATDPDTTAYTSPTLAARPDGLAIPGDAAYVFATSIRWEIPAEAVVDLGIASPAGDPSIWTLNWNNQITDFDPVGIDGIAADPDADRATNNYRASSFVVKSSGSFTHYYVGKPNEYGNTSPTDFRPGWAVFEGPAGSSGSSSGEGQLYPGQTTLSATQFSLGTATTQMTTSFLACQAWDNSLTQLDAGDYETSAVARLQGIPSNGAAAWLHGLNLNDQYYTDPALAPQVQVEYGTGLGSSGAGSTCDDADSPDGWFSDPALVPGNDASLLADGVYSAVTRVRMHLQIPAPATSGGPWGVLAVALRAEPSLPTGITLPVWSSGKIAFGEYTMREMLDPAFTTDWYESLYDPADNSGRLGDRLRTSRAIARLRKEVLNPSTGTYGTNTPQYTGGQTASFRITPTLTAGVSTPATVDTMIEDCLPNGMQFQSATLAPSMVQPTAPASASLMCASGETYIRWELGPQPINSVLDPIEYTVRLSVAITAGTKVNTARVTAEGDASAVGDRTATAQISLVQPAGVVLDKVALTPIVELNGPFETTLAQLSWRVDFANLETSPGPTNIDIIDVFPKDGENGSSFSGALAFDTITITQGDTAAQPVEVLYTDAASLSHDANHATNDEVSGSTTWCDAPVGGTAVLGAGTTCPTSMADVTGARVRRNGAFGPSDIISFEVHMTPSANTVGDTYVNTAAGRGDGLALLTGPVTAPEEIVGSSVGDTVFYDSNFNGLQDDGETGVEGVRVQIEGVDSDGNTVAPYTTQTDSNGHYNLGWLQSGDYVVTFDGGSLGANEEFTYPNEGNDDLVDSDGDPVTGVATVSIPANTQNVSVDQGVIEPAADVAVVKKINDDDAQAAPGVTFSPGDLMNVTFEVTNTGNMSLGSVRVTDTHIASQDISCPPVVLAPGEMTVCTATHPAPAPGFQHTNTGLATATPAVTPAGTQRPDVTDSDIANAHVVADPQVDIITYVVPNGQQAEMDDANDGEGLAITVNGVASWFYEVTNPGNTELSIIDLIDDNGTAESTDDWSAEPVVIGGFNAGDSDQDGLLDPGETWQFVSPADRNLVVTEPTYTSRATVSATPTYPDPPTLTADDPAIHHGNPLSVAITKFVQSTEDANDAPGPLVAAGTGVSWTYVVTNDGAVELFDLVVTDDQIDDDTIDCGSDNNLVAGPLAPGESFNCSATGTAIADQYQNLGSVDGFGPTLPAPGGGELIPTAVHAEDPANYFGVVPAVEIVKYTQTIDANSTDDQPLVSKDATVAWTYVVSNTGNSDLYDVTVADDQIDDDSTIACAPGSSNVVQHLAVGDTVSCLVTGPAIRGQYVNTGSVTATGPETLDVTGSPVPGTAVTDQNPSHYFGISPNIDVIKTVQTADANEAPGPFVASGDVVRWVYTVTNTGNVALSDISLSDDMEGTIECPKPSLIIDESMQCVHQGIAGLNLYTNVGTVSGIAPPTLGVNGDAIPGDVVTDNDPANHFAANPSVDIIKKINSADANTAPGLSIRPGGHFDFTYEVTNNGNVTLTELAVADDRGVMVTCPSDMLEPTATMVCTGEGTAPLEGGYVNTGTVTGSSPNTIDADGRDIPGSRVSDSDMAHATVRTTFENDTPTTTLAFTGANSKAFTLAGLLLIVGGLVLLVAGRRAADDEAATA